MRTRSGDPGSHYKCGVSASIVEAGSEQVKLAIVTAVYVRLLDEGADVWRPVEASEVRPGIFQLVTTSIPAGETWEFAPGSCVECEERILSHQSQRVLRTVAVRGEGEPPDTELLKLLRSADSSAINVHLSDGRALVVQSIAWGYDVGDAYAHVTANVSPSLDRIPIEFFYTNEVIAIHEPNTNLVLWSRAP